MQEPIPRMWISRLGVRGAFTSIGGIMDKRIAGLLGAAAALTAVTRRSSDDGAKRQNSLRRQVIGIFLILFRTQCRCCRPTMRGAPNGQPTRLPRSRCSLVIITIITTIITAWSSVWVGIIRAITIITTTIITTKVASKRASNLGARLLFLPLSPSIFLAPVLSPRAGDAGRCRRTPYRCSMSRSCRRPAWDGWRECAVRAIRARRPLPRPWRPA